MPHSRVLPGHDPGLTSSPTYNCSSNLERFRTVGELILSNRPTRQPCHDHMVSVTHGVANELCSKQPIESSIFHG
eukprot:1136949-Pelagomonas_calceolata.AAC.6